MNENHGQQHSLHWYSNRGWNIPFLFLLLLLKPLFYFFKKHFVCSELWHMSILALIKLSLLSTDRVVLYL